MMDKREPRVETRSVSVDIPVTPRRIPSLIRLVWALRKADRRQDLDEDSPQLVTLSQHSDPILKRAP